MNLVKTLCLSVLAMSLAYGADEKPKISKETQAAIDKAIDGNLISANKAYVAFRFELEKAQDKILKDLEKLKITATKAGDLDSAIAIDAQIKSVKEKGMLADRVAESGGELLGDSKQNLLSIVSAKYGSDSKWVDVTDNVKGMIIDNSIVTKCGGFGISDPLPNVRKTVIIEYFILGVKKKLVAMDGEDIKINAKK